MAAHLDSASAICSSHHSWHIGSDSGVESAPILFPEGIWHQADVRLSGYQNPFCYIADLWHSIAELWQPLWCGLFSHLTFPMLTEWCCFCHWWYDWDKGWPLRPQFQLPARSWRLIGKYEEASLGPSILPILGWRHASTWASCACKLCLWGHVGLRDRGCCGHFPRLWCFGHQQKGCQGGHHPSWFALKSSISAHSHLISALGKQYPGEV